MLVLIQHTPKDLLLASRRGFIALSVSALVCPMLTLPSGAQQPGAEVITPANLATYEQGLLTAANFEKVVGTRFWVRLPDGTSRAIVLHEVKHRTTQMLTPAQTKILWQNAAALRADATAVLVCNGVPDGGRAATAGHVQVDSAMRGRFAMLLVAGHESTCHATFSSFGAQE